MATLTTTLIAVPLAFAIARLDFPGKLLLIGLAALPLVLPSFVGRLCAAPAARADPASSRRRSMRWGMPFGSIYGTPGIVTVYTLTLYPYVLLPTVAGFKAIDASVEEAAQSLGSSLARTFRTVTLPIVIPSVLSGALLVFIETIENFGVPAVLAEDKPILAVEAYKLFIGETATNPVRRRRSGRAADLPRRRRCSSSSAATWPAAGSRPARVARHAADQDRRAAGALLAHRLLLDRGAAGAGAVLRHRRAVVHGVSRAGAACGLQPAGTMPSCSPPPAGRSPTR